MDPNWPFEEARRLFLHPEVTPADEVDLKWTEPDEEGLVEFMCTKNGFQWVFFVSVRMWPSTRSNFHLGREDRIRNGIKRIKAARGVR